MKFVTSSRDSSAQVWLLTKEMLDAVKSAGIRLEELYQLPKHHHKLAFSDIMSVAVLEYSMALKFGKATLDVFDPASYDGEAGAVLKAKITSVLNNLPRSQVLTAFNQPDRFYVSQTQKGFILCQGNTKPESPLWADTDESYFANAMLKSLYDNIGYYKIHFNDVTSASPGYFNLADVIRILV